MSSIFSAFDQFRCTNIHFFFSSGFPETVFQFNMVLFRDRILKCSEETFRLCDDGQNKFSIKICKDNRRLQYFHGCDVSPSLIAILEWFYEGENELGPVTFSGFVEVISTGEGAKPFKSEFTSSCLGKKQLSTRADLLLLSPIESSNWLSNFYRKKVCSIMIGEKKERITCLTLIIKSTFRLDIHVQH